MASDWLAACCQPIRSHVWKFLSNKLDFDINNFWVIQVPKLHSEEKDFEHLSCISPNCFRSHRKCLIDLVLALWKIGGMGYFIKKKFIQITQNTNGFVSCMQLLNCMNMNRGPFFLTILHSQFKLDIHLILESSKLCLLQNFAHVTCAWDKIWSEMMARN